MEGNIDETVCGIALNKVFGFNPKIAHALIDSMGSAREVFSVGTDRLAGMLGPFSRYGAILEKDCLEKAYQEYREISSLGVEFLTCTDTRFPALLKDCADSPAGVYVRSGSDIGALFSPDRTMVSIVGTRDMTEYGEYWCRKIVEGLALSGKSPTIVSGLAYGIDITAHKAALDRGIPTIAVMATGIDSVYPHRHRSIAERIASSKASALISDYPLRTMPLKINFLRRNRIIAGMSEATILVESKDRGGGILTSNLAFSYGRNVYAVPGRIDDKCSQGCMKLISAKVAEPVMNVESLLKSLGLGIRCGKKNNPEDTVRVLYGEIFSPGEMAQAAAVLKGIQDNHGITVEELSLITGVDFGHTSSLTALFESDGIISVDLLHRCLPV